MHKRAGRDPVDVVDPPVWYCAPPPDAFIRANAHAAGAIDGTNCRNRRQRKAGKRPFLLSKLVGKPPAATGGWTLHAGGKLRRGI